MKETLIKNSKNKKMKLNKELQINILKFFAKTSIPRMIQSINKENK